MEQSKNPNLVPIGRGGTWGHIGRMVAMVLTAGFAYPRAFVEGMDCTAIQKTTQGTLYDKKETEGTLYDEKDKKSSPSNAKNVAKTQGTERVSASA